MAASPTGVSNWTPGKMMKPAAGVRHSSPVLCHDSFIRATTSGDTQLRLGPALDACWGRCSPAAEGLPVLVKPEPRHRFATRTSEGHNRLLGGPEWDVERLYAGRWGNGRGSEPRNGCVRSPALYLCRVRGSPRTCTLSLRRRSVPKLACKAPLRLPASRPSSARAVWP